MGLLLPLVPGDWYSAGRRPTEQRITYSDGYEFVARDRRGRVTRHIVARAGRPHTDSCYKYVREPGGVRRVRITAEEWERLHDGKPKPAKIEGVMDGTPPQKRGNAARVDENDENTD